MELQLSNLAKQYRGGIWGLKEVSLSSQEGVLGLVGPNGAGKSTLMRILATVTRPSEGEATFDGINMVDHPEQIRSQLGYMPQEFGVYPHLTAEEFLTYLAAARGLSGKDCRLRIRQLLELVNLGDASRQPLRGFSGGMKQRVGIAQALLGDPRLLIVDEPTAGLDPEERVRFRNLLAELAGDRLVLLSSHVVSDIEAVATSIAVINEGRLLEHCTPEEMLRQAQGCVWETVVPSEQLLGLKEQHAISNTTRTPEGIKVRLVGDEPPTESCTATRPNLEDAYIYLVSKARTTTSV